MKYFFASLTFVLLFSSCADKNAFSRFGMDGDQELSASSLQSSKIVSGGVVDGVFSAIYLNEVYSKRFREYETFYIFLYLKQKQQDFSIKLNGKEAVKVEKLPHANEFSHLVSMDSEWQRYYLVTFEKSVQDESEKELNLVLESGQSSSAVLKYRINEQ